jgi:hypothetical protein
MPEYKRNQIEEAISKLLEPSLSGPSTEIRTRVKRILEADRALGRMPRGNDPEIINYAFYSADPPGTGVEVWFSGYEAFALLNGLLLMSHGWTQGYAVTVMRRVRPELETEHARILKQDPTQLFDQEALRRKAKPGDMAFNNTDPVLLMIITKSGASLREPKELLACAVRRGPAAARKFFGELGGSRAGMLTMSDVVGIAHNLSKALARTEPQRRGRN